MKIKTETQTGSIVSFKYDDEIAEITGLTTSFEPKQDGTPWMSDLNQTPYLLRQSPQYGHDYDREVDTLIGGSIAWNQLAKNGNFADTSNWQALNSTLSVSNNTGTITVLSSDYNYEGIQIRPVTYLDNHIYFFTVDYNASNISNLSDVAILTFVSPHTAITSTARKGTLTTLYKCTGGGTDGRFQIAIRMSSNAIVSQQATVKNAMLTDLTAFNSEIADYVYSLEQSTSGSGVAWLKEHFPKLFDQYHAYDAGSLVSVKTSEHRTTGKNLLNPSNIELGLYKDADFNKSASTVYCSAKAYVPKGTYVFSFDKNVNINRMIKDGEYSTSGSQNTRTQIVTSTKDGWIGLSWRDSTSSSTDWDITSPVQLEFGSTATAYEPYESHSYPLDSDLELRGIPKLSNGSLYYDGDEYTADGTVTRKYAIVDLGTLTYGRNSSGAKIRFQATLPQNIGNSGWKYVGGVCAKYQLSDTIRINLGSIDKVFGFYDNDILIYDSQYVDTASATFATEMSGIYLVYELATPTTETADPFASPQIVSPFGTEEYVDERSVPVPVGHRTTYMLPYPISGWDKIKVFVSPTEEEEDATIYTINLNGTRYGGTIDFFRGVMTLNMVDVDLGSLNWTYATVNNGYFYSNAISGFKYIDENSTNYICSNYRSIPVSQRYQNGTLFINSSKNVVVSDATYTNATAFKSAMNGVKLVYELAEPIEVQLTAQQIEALQGQNYVWCDSGDTTLTWRHIPVLDEAVMLNGKYLELTIDGYSTLGTSGRRSLGRQLDTYSVGTADGETVKNSTFPSRKITVNYVIQTDTEEELTDAINQLANILNQDECDFVFRDEPDKFFSGYGLLDSEPKKYRHAVKGTWSLYCAYPFKRSNKLVELSSKDPTVASVDAHSATFTFDYNGTLPAHPILRAEFASAKSGGEYNEDGDCGYVAFLDAEENIIQLGNPEVLDVDQYANATLINREFTSLSGWTASGVTVGDLTDQFWQNGKGQTQSYAKGTGSFTKSVGNGAINMEFDIVHRLCVSAANQTGAFECYAKNGNKIVVGFKIEKTGSGTTGTVSYILNDKVVGTDSIDLSYYNTHFGYCNRTAVYGTEYYSVYEKYYVKKKGKKKKKYHWVTYPRTVQTGWSYTQSNLNSGWSKDGPVVIFSVGNLPDRTFKNSDVELTPSTSIVFNISGSFHTNAVHSCAMLSKAGVPFAEIPNVFTAGDVVEGDCNSADVMLYRKGSLEGHLEPQYGALGNDWEDFEIKPGKNIIRAVWSDWVNTSYKPEIKIIFNEVYV